MLARLTEVPGHRAAAVDHSGTLLRLTVTSPDAVQAVRELLAELGYEGRELPGDEARVAIQRVTLWHARDTVFDLSREESEVVAAEIVSCFAAEVGLDPARRGRVREIVERGLYETFTTREHGVRSLIAAAALSISANAVPLLDPTERAALEARILSWSSHGGTR